MRCDAIQRCRTGAAVPVRYSRPSSGQHAGASRSALGNTSLAGGRGGRGDVHRAPACCMKLYPPDQPFLYLADRRAWQLLALMAGGSELDVIAIIGIILLIGHRQEKRHHDDRLRAGRRNASRACRRVRLSS